MRDETGATDRLVAAFDRFKPVVAEREADLWMAKWLQDRALDTAFLGQVKVWLLVTDDTIAAYHTEEPGTCTMRTGHSVLSVHMTAAARDRSYPGGGDQIVKHLLTLAREHGRDYVTLDPIDAATTVVWERHGFRETLTQAHEDPEADCFRMVRELNSH